MLGTCWSLSPKQHHHINSNRTWNHSFVKSPFTQSCKPVSSVYLVIDSLWNGEYSVIIVTGTCTNSSRNLIYYPWTCTLPCTGIYIISHILRLYHVITLIFGSTLDLYNNNGNNFLSELQCCTRQRTKTVFWKVKIFTSVNISNNNAALMPTSVNNPRNMTKTTFMCRLET